MKRAILSVVLALSMGLCSLSASAVEERDTARTDSADANARRVVYLVNTERTAQGLGTLIYSPELSRAAQVRAREIRTSFSHTRPDGRSCFTVLSDAGISYRSAGENIAMGQRTPEEVMKAWMNSAGHRENILSQRYQYIGVGVVCGTSCSWAQLFAASDSLTGVTLTEETSSPAVTTAPEETRAPAVTTAPEKDCGPGRCVNVNSVLQTLIDSVCAKGSCSQARSIVRAVAALRCPR